MVTHKFACCTISTYRVWSPGPRKDKLNYIAQDYNEQFFAIFLGISLELSTKMTF